MVTTPAEEETMANEEDTGIASQVRQPAVFVITLNWNTSEETTDCVASLLKVADPEFDLIVVDNGSDDGSVMALERSFQAIAAEVDAPSSAKWHGRALNVRRYRLKESQDPKGLRSIHFIEADQNYGFPGGNNIGISYARAMHAQYVVLLNNDTVVEPSFLAGLVQVAEADSSIGLVGSKVYYYDAPKTVQTVGVRVHWLLGRFDNIGNEEDRGQFDTMLDRDAIYATSMLARCSMLNEIGDLDESFVFGIEEYDLCKRATNGGFRVVYAPGSRIWHKGGRSAAKLAARPEAIAMIQSSRGFLGLKYEAAIFKKHLPFPLYSIPIALRAASILVGFGRTLVLVSSNRVSFSGRAHVGGVDRLLRFDAESVLNMLFPSRQRK